ncbi:5'-3' exonuclease [Gephyromycinifex aptenodytis]|uniref:5'-3' exonuclease n=1 Tax=Gephyromycinifex aptenodytis TaxID=2716227 RepID=UPI001445AC0F|nr:5'-3' exonuclease [Gephyromycinifex aptenodytis]
MSQAPRSIAPLLLLDSASLYFRAFYGVPERRSSPEKTPTNAIRGLLDMIASLALTHRPSGMVACWDDDWRPAFRVQAIPTYKEHRLADGGADGEQVPPELSVQVPLIQEVLAAIGIERIGCPGYEADDVIGTLTTRAVARGVPVRIVTGDRDLFQLVDDEADVVVVYTARGGVRGADLVDQAYLQQQHGVTSGQQYLDLAVLRGDPSDGLPGVKGVGAKTGVKLMQEYTSLTNLRSALERGEGPTGAVGSRLVAAREYLGTAVEVVRVVRDCPIAPVSGAIPARVHDPAALGELIERLGIGTSVNRVLTALGTQP